MPKNKDKGINEANTGTVVGILKVIGILLIIFTTGFATDNYFAKEKEVNIKFEQLAKNQETLDIRIKVGIIEDQITYAEQAIQNIKIYSVFIEREKPYEPTELEKQTIKNAEDRLKKLIKTREEIILGLVK